MMSRDARFFELVIIVLAVSARAGAADTAPSESGVQRARGIDALAVEVERCLQSGNLLDAACALQQQAELFIGFDHWEQLTTLDTDRPASWRESRRLQRMLAIEALDRASVLAGDDPLAAEAAYRKAELYGEGLSAEPDDAHLALLAYRTALRRWPEHASAPRAAFQIAELLERYRGDSVAAVQQYERLIACYPGSDWARGAAAKRREILSAGLRISAAEQVRAGESADIHFVVRNLQHVAFRAYRVDLFEAARQTDALEALRGWVPPSAPVAAWDLPLADDGRHRVFDSRAENGPKPTRLPLSEPGAYVIIGEGRAGEARVQDATIMVISDLAVTCTSGPRRCLVYAADARTGLPQRQAEVLVIARRAKMLSYSISGTTDDAGVCTLVHPEKLEPNASRNAHVYVRHGENYAACEVVTDMAQAPPRYRIYAITDRPIYQPGQTVQFKQIVRRVLDGAYENVTNRTVIVQLCTPQGDVLERQTFLTDEYGSLFGRWRLSEASPLGRYTLKVRIPDEPDDNIDLHGGTFTVEEYRRPEFDVIVRDARSMGPTPRPAYRIGEEVEATVTARYPYGSPVAGAQVNYQVYFTPFTISSDEQPVPGNERRFDELTGDAAFRRRELVASGTTTTDDNGSATLRFPSAEIASTPEADLEYAIEAEVSDAAQRVVKGNGSIRVAHTPFFITVKPTRMLCRPGEAVQFELSARTADGDPFRFRGRARFYRWRRYLVEVDGRQAERFDLGEEVFDQQITLDGNGRAAITWTPQLAGPFRVVVTTQNKDGLTVKGACTMWVGQTGGRYPHYAYRELELVADQSLCKTDEPIRLLVNTKFDNAYVLLTTAAAELIDQRVVFVAGGSAVVDLPFRDAYAPNVLVSASLVRDGTVYTDCQELSFAPHGPSLDVRIAPSDGTFRPQQRADVHVVTRAETGAPAASDVTLFAIDASVYAVYPGFREEIRRAFYGAPRECGLDSGASLPTLAQRLSRGDAFGGAGGRDDASSANTPHRIEREAPPVVRHAFPETILWLPALRTDRDGQAAVELSFPDTLATWAVHAIAVDRDTRVGEARIDLITRKDVLVRLEAPRFLVERDSAVITVTAANDLNVDKTVEVELRGSDEIAIGRARLNGQPLPYVKTRTVQIVVPARGAVAVEFDAMASSPGTAALTAWARTNVESDAAELRIPVHTCGAQRVVTRSGSVRGTGAATMSFDLPAQIDPRPSQMTVYVSPSIARVLVDALPYLIDYPYGCTEQTMSRFLPAVAVRRTLNQLGIQLGDIKRRIEAAGGENVDATLQRLSRAAVFDSNEMDGIIASSLKRLADMQNRDGAWGWWSHDESDPYMTAYVVHGLSEALSSAGAADPTAVERNILTRASEYLRTRLAAGEPADANVQAWMLFALARADPLNLLSVELRSVLNGLFERRTGLTDYARALLAIMLHQMGDAERAGIVIAQLDAAAQADPQKNLAHWGPADPTHRWYDNPLESTAMSLRALLLVAPQSSHIPSAVNWIVQARHGVAWSSTKESAFAIEALADYLSRSGALNAAASVTVRSDSGTEQAFSFAPENMLWNDATVQLKPRELTAGPHTITFETAGDGHVYFTVRAEFVGTQDSMAPTGDELTITRRYARLVARQVQKSRTVWDEKLRRQIEEAYTEIEDERVPLSDGAALRLGERIEVQLEIAAADECEYLMLVDPKPGGCEATDLISVQRSFAGLCAHVQPRDQNLVFFIPHLPQGESKLAYTLRCETPGTFTALPAQIEAMYAPGLRASSGGDRLIIAPAVP